MKPKRVLQIPGVLLEGGVENVIMNWYRRIDRNAIQFDFLVSRNFKGPLDDEITSLGGRIVYAPTIREKGLGYISCVANIIKRNGPYDVVHIHSAHMGVFSVLSCKIAKVKKIIYHVHSTQNLTLRDNPFKILIEKTSRLLINKFSNVKYACSEEAGKFVFGSSDFIVVNNAVDLAVFYPYNNDKIQLLREMYSIPKESIIVGNVSRFVKGKNQDFLIRIISEDKNNGGGLFLVLVGDGVTKRKVEELAEELNCKDRVLFMGARNDTPNFYNIFDVFVLPSDFEGLSLVTVEAQACGIPCVISYGVPDEVDMGVTSVKKCDLKDPYNIWNKEIYSISKDRVNDSTFIKNKICKKGYSLDAIIKQIEQQYEI